MSGVIVLGTCDVCNNEGSLNTTYFYYGVKCECHSPEHFRMIHHCDYCVPEDPGRGEIHFSNEQKHKLEYI